MIITILCGCTALVRIDRDSSRSPKPQGVDLPRPDCARPRVGPQGRNQFPPSFPVGFTYGYSIDPCGEQVDKRFDSTPLQSVPTAKLGEGKPSGLLALRSSPLP